MMKLRPASREFSIGPHLCAGLTLGHYENFRECASLAKVLARFERELPEHVRWGVHLLVSQHENGDLTVGDSHEYGLAHDPFLRSDLDALIVSYLSTFLDSKDLSVTERWTGTYAKHPSRRYILDEIASGIVIANGVGGAGMTLSFGFAEHTYNEL